jgi:hypothetical protein
VKENKTMYRYRKPVYSKEQYRIWAEEGRKAKEFAEKHSSETVKDYEIAGYTIRCIQRKYDKCMNKENEYGVQVWADKPENVPIEKIHDYCVSNEWFNNPTEANEHFKQMKAMCY